MLRKLGILAAIITAIATPVVVNQLPLPLLQWGKAVVNAPELLDLLNGAPRTYRGDPVVAVYPVPGRIDQVRVIFPMSVDSATTRSVDIGDTTVLVKVPMMLNRGEWTSVHRTSWDLFEEVE